MLQNAPQPFGVDGVELLDGMGYQHGQFLACRTEAETDLARTLGHARHDLPVRFIGERTGPCTAEEAALYDLKTA